MHSQLHEQIGNLYFIIQKEKKGPEGGILTMIKNNFNNNFYYLPLKPPSCFC